MTSRAKSNELTGKIVDAAMKVHTLILNCSAFLGTLSSCPRRGFGTQSFAMERTTALPETGAAIDRLAAALLEHHPGRRGELLASFARLLHGRTRAGYFSELGIEQLEAGVVSMFDFLETSPADTFRIRVESPSWLESREGEARTAIEVTSPDQPFLVDTLREIVRSHGLPTLELFHPILSVERDEESLIRSLAAPSAGGALVSFMHLETERLTSAAKLRAIEDEAERVFAQLRRVARDFQPMVAKLHEVSGRLRSELERAPGLEEREEIAEAVEFLLWLLRSNFVFLGYREYVIGPSPAGPAVALKRGSGLGILHDERRSSMWEPRPLADLPADLRRRVSDRRILTVHKTNAESQVVRRTRMDYIGVKQFDADGQVTGEQRFLGLFTARALADLPADIPVLRRKLAQILERTKVVKGSHDHKEIFSIFCSIPKSELFVSDVESLQHMVLDVLDAQDRLDVRVRYRPDTFERGVAVMVLMPRERFNPANRHAIQDVLAREFGGTLIDYRLALSDEPLARLHFYFSAAPGRIPTPSIAELEAKVAGITRTWDERLRDVLEGKFGVEEGNRLSRKYAGAFPPSYTAVERPETAAEEIPCLEAVEREGKPPCVIVSTPEGAEPPVSWLKIFRAGEQYHLSSLMPSLTNLGLDILDESTFLIESPRAGRAYLHFFRVLGPTGGVLAGGAMSRRLEEAVFDVLLGRSADDRLNSLVVAAGLSSREVEVLRAYTSYLRQLEGSLRQETAYSTLIEHSAAARALVELFEARFQPRIDAEARRQRQEAARAALDRALEAVPGFYQDQILRGYENLILATVRTSYFQRTASGRPKASLALKVRCADVRRMPLPRPLYEIFVSTVRMEGVHLRSGKVARGGIRWSERRDDFRTEILGLMKAQRTKNALIVPVGAKGGFVLKKASAPERLGEEIEQQYEIFIDSLLDLTDNNVGDRIVHPPDTVIHDGEDTYLVVAADRGTAQFSDLANRIAQSRCFWLGDAFASGGSHGYNHKQEGITARGAWECITRHFLELGTDIQTQGFTIAGIGDMSGDVFGNGMLLSPAIRLVAAFNHQHIFLDPDPDPILSFAERRRLFDLPRSSWDEYDRRKLSAGGDIFRRDAKAIALSPQARRRLGVDAETLNGTEVIRAILRLQVDLLFNGGIGTYIKATTESHHEVGDPINDAVRIDASEVGARVIGEGGNLGITQRGRVELARRAVRLNTDFIDNSAGVDLSDHEVNLKILLREAIKRGALRAEERDALLKEVTEEVDRQVLADNYLQSGILSLEERRGPLFLDQMRFVLDDLATSGVLDRALEHLPGEAEILKLRDSGMGLARPQLCVLLAYVKIDAYQRVVATEYAASPDLHPFLTGYFPAGFARRFAAEIAAHPLRREIAVTSAVNECVNRMGLVFLHRLAREFGTGFDRVLHAYIQAAALAGSRRLHDAFDRLYAARQVPISEIYEAASRQAEAVESLARWCLRRGKISLSTEEVLARYGAILPAALERLQAEGATRLEELRAAAPHLPGEVLELLLGSAQAVYALEVADLAEATGSALEEAFLALTTAGERLAIERLEREIERIVKGTADDWQMCAALGDELQDLRRELAGEILALLPREERRSLEESAARIAAAAVRRLPGGHPARERIERALALSRTREPLTPSKLFVLVEELRRVR
jgi:glutamate dehydrogenase